MNIEYVDVVIVGAGLSGIGAAYHLQEQCPNKSYLILEGREALGGTWDLFRYPGIRSDSDMYTLGYSFKPWREAKAIADGPAILKYLRETAEENQIADHIRYNHMMKSAAWSTPEQSWTITVAQTDTAEQTEIRCNFLLMCAGYYSYEQGHTPEFPGQERFTGTMVHPQHWPENFDYTGKNVVVIGSGATAVTLIPAMAEKTAHITMLQRSPTYVASVPAEDRIANFARRVLPEKLAYNLVRWKNITYTSFIYRQSRKNPDKVKQTLLDQAQEALGPDYDLDTHFTPHYNPWDQRLCAVPDGDLFEVIKAGKASVVTDHIDTFTETGIQLQSGRELEADIIITATGLNVILLGGASFSVDGRPVEFSETYTYKGAMYSDIPNLVSIFGYINASWTLRSDLISEFVCRVLHHLDETNTTQVTPRLRPSDQNMGSRMFIEGFSSNYLARVMHLMPKQGDKAPWINCQDYGREKKLFRREPVDDGVLVYEQQKEAAPTT